MTKLENKMKRVIEKYLNSFDSPRKIKTEYPTIDKNKYFLKMAGKNRVRYMKNEIYNFSKISSFLPFYKDYYITSLEKNEKMGMIVKCMEGEDLTDLLHERHKCCEVFLLGLYSMLLTEIKMFHVNNLNHGDIKAGNFFMFKDLKKDQIAIRLIDFESVNDFSDKKGEHVIQIHTKEYDFPSCISRKKFDIINETSFLFYQFLDIFSVSLLILYIYNHSIYKKILKGRKWNLSNIHPKNFVKGDSPLEKTLFYVFNFLPENKCLKNVSLDIKTKEDIPNIKKMIRSLDRSLDRIRKKS